MSEVVVVAKERNERAVDDKGSFNVVYVTSISVHL
jgi:hypothetical protein